MFISWTIRSRRIFARPNFLARRSSAFDNGSIVAVGAGIGMLSATGTGVEDEDIAVAAAIIIIDGTTEESLPGSWWRLFLRTCERLLFALVAAGRTLLEGRLRSKRGRERAAPSLFDIAQERKLQHGIARNCCFLTFRMLTPQGVNF